MKFAAIVLSAGLVGTLVVSNLQGATIAPAPDLGAAVLVDGTVTGSIAPAGAEAAAGSARLIDLQSGSTCRLPDLDRVGDTFRPAAIGADCAGDPALDRVAQWRSDADGMLEMADAEGRTVYRFQPGDGVLFESVYPENALVTIVPVRG